MEEETKTIKGEIEGWAKDVREFGGKGNRGSRGVKVENEWHNMVDTVPELEKLSDTFPNGSQVQFKIAKNKRGYWDIDGDIEFLVENPVTKDKEKPEGKVETTNPPAPMTHGLIQSDRDKTIQLQVCFKSATELLKTYYQGSNVNDLDGIKKNVLILTEDLYNGIKEVKSHLQGCGEW